MIRSTICSISAAITSLRPSTELPGAKHSRSGPKSAAWLGNKFLMHTASPCFRLIRPDKLTVPDPPSRAADRSWVGSAAAGHRASHALRLGPGRLPACHHGAVLTPGTLLKLGLSPAAK